MMEPEKIIAVFISHMVKHTYPNVDKYEHYELSKRYINPFHDSYEAIIKTIANELNI